MTEVRNSFFGANAVDEGDDLKMAVSVIQGDGTDGATIDVKDLTIRLRVHDGETKEKYVVEIAETETWDWKDPGVWRVINGWQVNSYGTLFRSFTRSSKTVSKKSRCWWRPGSVCFREDNVLKP